MSSCVLDHMKRPLNAFTDCIDKLVKSGGILLGLVASFGSIDGIACCGKQVRLPFCAKKTFIAKDGCLGDLSKDDLSGLPLVGVGWDKIIVNRQSFQRRKHDQFVAEVVHLPTRTIAIAGAAREIATPF